MKTILFLVLILFLIPASGFAKETFFVETNDIVSLDGKRVELSYTFINDDSIAISHLDVEPHKSVSLENIELPAGWAVLGKNKKTIRLGAAGFHPGARIRIKFKVKVTDPERINIFQMREPVPLFTLNVYYANRSSKSWSIHPPFMPKMR